MKPAATAHIRMPEHTLAAMAETVLRGSRLGFRAELGRRQQRGAHCARGASARVWSLRRLPRSARQLRCASLVGGRDSEGPLSIRICRALRARTPALATQLQPCPSLSLSLSAGGGFDRAQQAVMWRDVGSARTVSYAVISKHTGGSSVGYALRSLCTIPFLRSLCSQDFSAVVAVRWMSAWDVCCG